MVELQAIEREDLPRLLTWRNDPENRRFFREYRPLNMEHQTAWFEALTHDRRTQMFMITHGGNPIGVCGLTSIDWLARSAEISLYIGDGYIGMMPNHFAFAHLALHILGNYATEVMGLRRLWVEIWDFDIEKRALLEKSGYALEVTKRQAHWSHGWHDALIYARLFE